MIRLRHLKFIKKLALIFITLKLCNIIYWNWIWVLSPLWAAIITTYLIELYIKKLN